MTAATAAASPPPTAAERAANLRRLGWTGRKAEWLALVCLHSGGFTRTQYQACYGTSQPVAARFIRALVDARVARVAAPLERGAGRPTGVCHVHHRSFYRALDIENNRHRRSGSPDLVMRRLLSLDYVLEHQDLAWLPTEPEKVSYFRRLGVPVAALPRREYRGPFSTRSTRRYFAFKLPVAGDGETTTFVYAEPGGRQRLQRERIRAWADAHGALWQVLRDRGSAVHVAAVTRTSADAAANAAILDSWRGEPAPAAPLSAADKQLLADVRRADATGDFSPLDKYGGWLEAGKAAHRIEQAGQAADPPPEQIDAYSTHVAERLAPDPTAL